MECVGQVINGTPTTASSNQFGNLQGVAGVDPPLQFTFYTEATTDKVVANGPLRVEIEQAQQQSILSLHRAILAIPISFRSGTPVQISSLRQKVIVDASTGAFNVVEYKHHHRAEFLSDGRQAQLGEAGQAFRTVVNGHLNAPGTSPTGWLGGYAVRAKD